MSRREFQLSEGSSNKFWAITLEESKFTVQYGRIGTKGQSQVKEFTSADEAEQAANKLIAEKTAKGYAEVGASASAAPVATATATKRKTKAAKEEPPAEVPPAPVEAPPAVVETAVTRHLDLEPEDWFSATWRDLKPLARPEVKPFDPDDCTRRFTKAASGATAHYYGYGWHWDRAAISPSVTPEEARFWFAAMTPSDQTVKPKELALYLQRQDFSESPSGSMMLYKLRKVQHGLPAEIMIPLATLATTAELAEILADGSLDTGDYRIRSAILAGFRKYLLPYLTPEEKEVFRRAVKANLPPAAPHNLHMVPVNLYLAAMLGLHNDVLASVMAWPDRCYTTTGYSARYDSYMPLPHHIILGLGTASLVDFHMRRVGLKLCAPGIIRGWLANTEYAGLDWVRESIQEVTNKDECDTLLREFCRVNAPEAAPHMLELRFNAKAPGRAREWIDTHVGNAVAGLIPVAAGRGKVAELAIDYLRDVKRRGFTALIEEQLVRAQQAGTAEATVVEAVRRMVLEHAERVYPALEDATTPEDLRTAFEAALTKAKLFPDWARPSRLPPLLVGDHCLNEKQVNAVLLALHKSTLAAPHPLLPVLCRHVERPHLDAFAWKLFELWQGEGSPSKEKWAFTALGHLGGDASVMKLTPLVKVWPGQSQHQRAVTGLECLRKIGTDTALMQLNSIAQKLKFKGLKTKAQLFMEEIARDRGMSRTQLEDRIVPDLDLDERGSRVFDFGPRQFKFVLDADMKPMVRDEAGKLKGELPKPNSKDDADKAKAATDAWKLLKKQIKEVVKIQAVRLEQAMVASRRWNVADFEKLLVRHPLMVNLVRRLLWGGFDRDGKLTHSFRVTEEQEYADSSDNAMSLDGVHEVGLVHPLHLSDEERARWGELFGDYEIIPPFPQLGRRVNTLEPGEETATEITRYKGPKINPLALHGILEKLGWTRGGAGDGGGVHYHTKDFPTAGVRAVIEYEPGYGIGYMDGSDDQTIERGYFVALSQHGGWFRADQAIAWGKVDRVVVSEVLGAMAILASKGT